MGLVEVECYNIKQTDCTGVTTLGWAAWNGTERVMEILLGQDDIRTNELDNISQKLTRWGMQQAQNRAVKIFLRYGVINLGKQIDYGATFQG